VNVKIAPRSRNHFLSSLPEEDYQRLKPHLESVEMEISEFVHAPYEPISYLYFPEKAVVSVVTFLEDGSSIETGIIGNEGVAGIGAILAEDVSPREASIQVADGLLKIKAENFKAEFERSHSLRRLSLRFVFAFIAQISQNVACVQRHRIDKRLARWLLMVQDRVEADELIITQEFIAQMLGVHRPGVTESAIKLQEQRLIRYTRGRVTILDRKGLENIACECYGAIKEAYDKYLKG
jgi:CRP-like cAMP-binding protein